MLGFYASYFNSFHEFRYVMNDFLIAFPKLRKATISFVISVCPSFHREEVGYHWMDFH